MKLALIAALVAVLVSPAWADERPGETREATRSEGEPAPQDGEAQDGEAPGQSPPSNRPGRQAHGQSPPSNRPGRQAHGQSPPSKAPAVGPPRWLLAPPTAPAAQPRSLDLGPSRLFRAGTPRLVSNRKNEKGALSFGDSTWKTHALQIGGMVAGFAGLAALCGGGKCMLPRGLGSWIPGTTTEAPPAPARVGPRVQGLPRANPPVRDGPGAR